MFDVKIFLYVLLAPFLFVLIAYGAFPRQTMNAFMKIIPAWRKRYVVCHVRYSGGLSEVFKVVPNLTGLTKVGKYSYQLEEKYAIMKFNNRIHYILDEVNAIPRTLTDISKDDVIFQAAEIQTALNNSVMDYLFSRKKEILIIGLFIVAIISIFAIVYNIIQINDLKALIQTTVETQQNIIKVK